jgi:uncharacterized protein YkwD
MAVTTKWALGLAVLLAALLQQPLAWGQLRTHSGAGNSGITHPKVLERQVFQLTNEARRKHGLSPLDPDQTLMTLARDKSDDMLKHHYFSHTDAAGKTIKELYAKEGPDKGRMAGLGENICVVGSGDPETAARNIVDGFMVSPGHRRNILEPAFTHLGIGISTKGKEYFVTQSFGASSKQKP